MNTNTSVRTNNTDVLTALKNSLRRYSVMSAEEEQEAFKEYAIANESRKAQLREQIANANLRFVLSVAQKYSSDGDRVAELVSVGTIGLYKAIDSFDVERGFKFITHAINWIRAEFFEFFRTEGSLVRRSNANLVGTKDRQIIEKYLQREHREPTEDELLEALESEFGVVLRNKLDVVQIRTKRIEDKANGEDESTFEDTAEFNDATASRNGVESEIEREHTEYVISQLMPLLTIKEQDIVKRYYGIGCTAMSIEDIAEEFDYSAERVRQIVVNEVPRKLRSKAKRLLAE
jgi:RNA polymerase primary sigma factor